MGVDEVALEMLGPFCPYPCASEENIGTDIAVLLAVTISSGTNIVIVGFIIMILNTSS